MTTSLSGSPSINDYVRHTRKVICSRLLMCKATWGTRRSVRSVPESIRKNLAQARSRISAKSNQFAPVFLFAA